MRNSRPKKLWPVSSHRRRAFFNTLVILLALSALAASAPAVAEDVAGSSDHPMLSRFPGSVITGYEPGEFGQFTIFLGKATGKFEHEATEIFEGKVTRVTYEIPDGHSALEVYRSYSSALENAGFDTLFSCSYASNCGGYFDFNFGRFPGNRTKTRIVDENTEHYLAARHSGPDGETTVVLFVYQINFETQVMAKLVLLEKQAMEQGLITVNAKALAQDIDRSGHAAVYGVFFDTDMAEIKTESEPALREIAALLKRNPELQLFVVGHTDNTGSLSHNKELSFRRAGAVVAELTSRYDIDGDRLVAAGVGPLAPVTSNLTPEGRAQNRRVELVRQ
ncbi:MAG: DUF4892 domain-containing protein [Thermoanaerobaculales bacterium]|nr:DUF4892 domain-containing protein [Thermoanaerobaculales bacterium]